MRFNPQNWLNIILDDVEKSARYFENVFTIVSKTSTGPVLPNMVSGFLNKKHDKLVLVS